MGVIAGYGNSFFVVATPATARRRFRSSQFAESLSAPERRLNGLLPVSSASEGLAIGVCPPAGALSNDTANLLERTKVIGRAVSCTRGSEEAGTVTIEVSEQERRNHTGCSREVRKKSYDNAQRAVHATNRVKRKRREPTCQPC